MYVCQRYVTFYNIDCPVRKYIWVPSGRPLLEVRLSSAQIYKRCNVDNHRMRLCQKYVKFCNIDSPVRKYIWVPSGGPSLQVRLSSAQIYREGQRGQSSQRLGGVVTYIPTIIDWQNSVSFQLKARGYGRTIVAYSGIHAGKAEDAGAETVNV